MSDIASSSPQLKCIIEALLLAAGEPLSRERIAALFEEGEAPSPAEITRALDALAADLKGRGIELVEVASGFRLQTRAEIGPWVQRLWEERPQRYSRALLETLALIAYRQPITRGEIEEVRGVSVSSNIVRTLQEREWIRVVGHRDVPGKPALFGTTRAFLDYFQLQNLDDLPTLAEIRDMESLEPEFDFAPLGGDETGEADADPAGAGRAEGEDDDDRDELTGADRASAAAGEP
jgi:segregation and condensation protein B